MDAVIKNDLGVLAHTASRPELVVVAPRRRPRTSFVLPLGEAPHARCTADAGIDIRTFVRVRWMPAK